MEQNSREAFEALRQHPEYPGLYAMSVRQQQETEYEQRLASSVVGDPQRGLATPAPVLDTLHDVTACYYAAQIEGQVPSEPIARLFADRLDDATLNEVIASYGSDVTHDDFRAFIEQALGATYAHFAPAPDAPQPAIPAVYEHAKSVAQDQGVSVAEVFERDDLYKAVVRRHYTPEAFVTLKLDAAESVDAASLAAYSSTIQRLQPGADPVMVAEYEALLRDPDLLAEIEHATTTAKAIAALTTHHLLGRFWGPGAFEALDAATKQRLESLFPPMPRVVEIGGLAVIGFMTAAEAAALKKREAFVADYFKTRGWDIDNPTIEQLLEVREQDGWQNP